MSEVTPFHGCLFCPLCMGCHICQGDCKVKQRLSSNYVYTDPTTFVCIKCHKTSKEILKEENKEQENLLDRFAMAAMPAVLEIDFQLDQCSSSAELAEAAYNFAEAMLKEKKARDAK